ncbi:oxidoreductase [Xylaria telfairii]|nr:oxidoreductase [Xylaria telfairii]
MAAESFDFIIAGGGTAGIALAARLSQASQQRALVLEAGLDHSNDPRVKTPAFYSALFGTNADWGFQTTAQQNLKGRSISLNQGKALGGSSVINAHVWAPPIKADWATVGRYYTKAFTPPQTSEELRRPLGVDGWSPDDTITANGPLQLSYPGPPNHPIREIWAKTFRRTGYLMKIDPWADASVGAFSNLASVDPIRRERSHAAKAYYSPVQDRENLHLVLEAYVDKIIFADDQPRAIGVQYRYSGHAKLVHARKEVIVSAGALQSPKLLELSGIGNADILKRHLACDIGFAAVDGMETLDNLVRQEPKALEQAMLNFTQHHDGLLTSGGIKTYAYLPVIDFLEGSGREKLVKLLEENRPAPEDARARAYHEMLEKTLLDRNRPSGVYLGAIGQNPTASDPGTGKPSPLRPGKHLTIATIPAQPHSRGTVHIVSDDATSAPEIDPKYLSSAVDREIFAQHMAYIETIAASAPLSEVLTQPAQRNSALAHITDAHSARRYMEARAISMWHPAGTCAMLPEKLGGVVDATLGVHGVRNLRVVDAGVVPLPPPGNLQSTVYAVAERAADLIMEAHGLSQ